MIRLSFIVDNITTVLQVYNQIRIQRGEASAGPFTTISGLGPINLVPGQTSYTLVDEEGTASNWYQSQYYSTVTSNQSSWSEPVLGTSDDLFHDPMYPPEISYGTSDLLIIDRIRTLIGDPKRIVRECGEEAMSSIHSDGKTYEMAQNGYPVSINVGGVSFTELSNPTVDGYRYLRFQEYIDVICTTCSGITDLCGTEAVREIEKSIDVWCYSFRQSDRQIMDVYDTCPPPIGLTTTNATSQCYMLQTAVDILRKELIEDATEDGAVFQDEKTKYDASEGQKIRKEVLDGLLGQLNDLVKLLKMQGISGVLID